MASADLLTACHTFFILPSSPNTVQHNRTAGFLSRFWTADFHGLPYSRQESERFRFDDHHANFLTEQTVFVVNAVTDSGRLGVASRVDEASSQTTQTTIPTPHVRLLTNGEMSDAQILRASPHFVQRERLCRLLAGAGGASQLA